MHGVLLCLLEVLNVSEVLNASKVLNVSEVMNVFGGAERVRRC